MEKMQKYMDFIFFEVWCKASDLGDFDLSLFDRNTDLQDIVRAFNFLDTSPEWGKYFLQRIKDIFELFKLLENDEIKKLKYWYKVNNNIKRLCDGALEPIIYKELKNIHQDLSKKLQELYAVLYNQKIIGLKDITNKIGKLDTHYKDFMTINNQGKCPFCGLSDMKGIHHTKREAYDHFLPKGKYPFNSINFKNLAPMCHECNSSYKLENNPIYDKNGNRRKAFYPYSLKDTNIDVRVDINSFSDIKPENITLTISAPEQEKVDTWIELFSIEERYKAVLSSDSDGKYWLVQLEDEIITYDDKLKRHYEQYRYNEKNFLKLAFFESYKNQMV
jgi:hypothetical protein